MALYRECCFPNCAISWWIKLISYVLGEAIAPIDPLDPPLVLTVTVKRLKREVLSVTRVEWSDAVKYTCCCYGWRPTCVLQFENMWRLCPSPCYWINKDSRACSCCQAIFAHYLRTAKIKSTIWVDLESSYFDFVFADSALSRHGKKNTTSSNINLWYIHLCSIKFITALGRYRHFHQSAQFPRILSFNALTKMLFRLCWKVTESSFSMDSKYWTWQPSSVGLGQCVLRHRLSLDV